MRRGNSEISAVSGRLSYRELGMASCILDRSDDAFDLQLIVILKHCINLNINVIGSIIDNQFLLL